MLADFGFALDTAKVTGNRSRVRACRQHNCLSIGAT